MKLIAEVKIKLNSLVAKAQEQLSTELAQQPGQIINVELPAMDFHGVKFADKGPRTHKAFC